MNRRQRRAEWAKGIRQASAEARGMMGLYVVRPIDFPALLKAAVADGGWPMQLADLVRRTVIAVHEAPATDRMQCLCCRQPLSEGSRFSVVLAVPQRSDPSKAITSGFCTDCGTECDVIETKALAVWKAELWPEARRVTISDQVGHA